MKSRMSVSSSIVLASFSGTFEAINPTNNQITIRVCANSGGSNEEWSIDNIQLFDNGAILPVELINFQAKLKNKKDIKLN